MPMSSYRVLDLTDDRGQYAGFLFAQLGADVICIEPPDGHRSRNLPPFLDATPGSDASLFHWSYNRGKRSVVAAGTDLDRLAAGADVVLHCGALDVDLTAWREANPGLITASMTPYGETGPKADWLGTDLTNMAAGGVMSVTGDKDRPPVRISQPQSWLYASADAVSAVSMALYERNRSGLGQHIDVSAQQSMISASQFSMMNALVDTPSAQRIAGGLELGPFKMRFVYGCADGHVSVTYLFGPVIGPYTVRLFQWMREEGACDDSLAEKDWIGFAMAVIEGRDSADELIRASEAIEAWTRDRTKAELLAGAMEKGALIAPIHTTRDLVDLGHLEERGYWETLTFPGQDKPVKVPGPTIRFGATPTTVLGPPPTLGQHTDEVLAEPTRRPATPAALGNAPARPLEGLKVVDFMWALAGPGTTRTLADFGATVIRIESQTRPEVLRAANPFRGEDGDFEGSLHYHSSNASKMHLQLNLSVPESREVMLDLVKWADVVTESFTPRARRKMGLDYDEFSKLNPSLIMLSSCLMGQTGPLRDYAGFGTAGAAMAGFFPVTGWPDRIPAGPYTAYTDYISPRLSVAAIMAALEHRTRTGVGQYIDFSQMESAMHMLSPLLLDEVLHANTATRSGNADPTKAPHVVVPAAGADRWVAIACETDEQWRTLAGIIGADQLGSLSVLERLEQAEELEEKLSAWTSGREPEAIQDQLQAAGVPAHQVQNSTECIVDPQLIARDQFRSVPHTVHGDSFVEGPAFTMSRSEGGPTWAGPTMGEHTFEILSDFLGYDGDKIADLAIAGVLE